MRSLFPVVLGALGLIFVDGVVAQDTPACVPACANQVRSQFTQYSCTSADDAACLCANANFGFGVRDCGQNGCGATDVQVQAFLSGSFCQGQQLAFSATGAQAPPTSSVPTGNPAATTPAGATTPVPTAPATSASIPETSIPSTSPQATGPPTTTPPASTGAPTSSPPTSTAPPPTTTGVVRLSNSGTFPFSNSTSSAVPSTTVPATSATSTPTSSETAAAGAGSGSGLSQGAAIGIGVGVAGGVVAIAFAAVFLFLRNRNRPHASFDISHPPSNTGSGQGAFEKYSNDIEMVSNRYEDMVPRQQPRVMV
ncbi:hypothetical protein M441DRAFT_129634 [Trichoderma asperellum CBS 433.97]|uniref:CFEM domain-containing protein n=1 Tax=Trichoderma asperellum (strain ATCC 204424 / CBS 433.97 / NBRC 101777) TaxID=1042311 RepID=A0A2T3ZM65_TRIA4|nr:hypothetical protein M441DRAFT_129634 [Trichoderma asperellum CBS 433.97]PTB45895.1 hypothetical protein M441DRAFT_129634 [Trichoderma asperellum CBS 433.97]